jgi:hypothetical protein
VSTRLLPQAYCLDLTDHPAHADYSKPAEYGVGGFRCPGRHTPSNHRAPHASPAVPTDPFAGIPGADEDEEF